MTNPTRDRQQVVVALRRSRWRACARVGWGLEWPPRRSTSHGTNDGVCVDLGVPAPVLIRASEPPGCSAGRGTRRRSRCTVGLHTGSSPVGPRCRPPPARPARAPSGASGFGRRGGRPASSASRCPGRPLVGSGRCDCAGRRPHTVAGLARRHRRRHRGSRAVRIDPAPSADRTTPSPRERKRFGLEADSHVRAPERLWLRSIVIERMGIWWMADVV